MSRYSKLENSSFSTFRAKFRNAGRVGISTLVAKPGSTSRPGREDVRGGGFVSRGDGGCQGRGWNLHRTLRLFALILGKRSPSNEGRSVWEEERVGGREGVSTTFMAVTTSSHGWLFSNHGLQGLKLRICHPSRSICTCKIHIFRLAIQYFIHFCVLRWMEKGKCTKGFKL